MVVKAQVARKLASRDPAQAAQRASDIEEIGRGRSPRCARRW